MVLDTESLDPERARRENRLARPVCVVEAEVEAVLVVKLAPLPLVVLLCEGAAGMGVELPTRLRDSGNPSEDKAVGSLLDLGKAMEPASGEGIPSSVNELFDSVRQCRIVRLETFRIRRWEVLGDAGVLTALPQHEVEEIEGTVLRGWRFVSLLFSLFGNGHDLSTLFSSDGEGEVRSELFAIVLATPGDRVGRACGVASVRPEDQNVMRPARWDVGIEEVRWTACWC